MPSRLGLLVLTVVLGWTPLIAQSEPPSQNTTSDQAAVNVANESLAALTGGKVVNDVVLVAVATVSASKNTIQGANLWAQGRGKSRVELLNGSVVSQKELRNLDDGYPVGSWSGKDGVMHPCAVHNCATDAAWFFPALLMFSGQNSNPDLVLTFVGEEQMFGVNVQHLRSSLRKQAVPALQQLSIVDLYIDSTSHLPSAIVFSTHPDNDSALNIPVVVRFSDYRDVDGVQVPFTVEKFIQGSLVLNLKVTSALINSGVPDALFDF
jgi:hypothetical protein